MSENDNLPGLEQATQALKKILHEFSPRNPAEETLRDPKQITKKYELDRKDIPIPQLTRFALQLIGCPTFGPGEKLAWGVYFSTGVAKCALTLEKFGARLYVTVPSDPHTAIDMEAIKMAVMKKLQSATKAIEKHILKPFSIEQIRAGGVTIDNQYHQLRYAYEYFRENCQIAFSGKGRLQERNYIRPDRTEGFYNLVATLNAYMSLLEHTLVLSLPFMGFNPEVEDLAGFISSRWGQKFQRLFKLNEDKVAKFHFDRLHQINEEWRNTYTHGGFDKQKASIYFHVPRVGAVPAALLDVRDSPHFNFIPADVDDFDRVVQILDDLDEWLRNGPASFGLQWAESGVPVRYDAEFREEVSLAVQSSEKFKRFAEYHWAMHDRAMNMDY